ncbi:hypothetical protein ABZ368_15195 [Streptomyces sp. NPDC005908]|uniref:hypothetical protein n=1 Tax=Streptomyces sp. NPDC005908 TaxID=3157084 RepID=UPI0033F26D77
MSTIEEPEPTRPWRPEDGPAPAVWTWPLADRLALRVWSAGAWRYAPVRARQDWPDGTVRYQVEVDLRGDTTMVTRTYVWSQEGLRVAHGSGSEPSQAADEQHLGALGRARRTVGRLTGPNKASGRVGG